MKFDERYHYYCADCVGAMMEHVGDISAVSATVGRNFMADPGLHRTLIGDGLATSMAAVFGGPANTTYSENTGVLALTRIFAPGVMRIAAGIAIVASLFPHVGSFIRSIPGPAIGGVSCILYGRFPLSEFATSSRTKLISRKRAT